MAVYITGDTHGDFRQIENFCAEMGTKQDDIMMILGDAGFNYFGDIRDDAGKMDVSHTHMTYFLVHGNHEMRPETVGEYRLVDWNGGMVYQEARFPRLLFAKDGEIYRSMEEGYWLSAGPIRLIRNTGCVWDTDGSRMSSHRRRSGDMWNSSWIRRIGTWMWY